MKGTSRRPVFVKILLLLLILVTVSAGGVLLYWETHKKKIIRLKVEQVIEGKSNGLYKVHYADMQLDEVGGNVSFYDMYIGYDTTAYLSVKEKTPVLLNIHIPSIHIYGVKTPKALLGKEIIGHLVEINDPSIEIIYTGHSTPSKNLPSKEVYEEILGKLKLIRMDTLSIHHAHIVTRHLNRNDSVVFNNTNITLTHVAVDSLSNADSTRILFARVLDLRCEKISWTEMAKRYAFTIRNISFNSDTAYMHIGNIDIIPQLSEDAFVKSMPFQSDRFDMHYTNIKLLHVDCRELMNEVLKADTLEVNSSSIKLYCDLIIPPNSKNPKDNYPQQQIMKIPLSFVIRRALFDNTYIDYRERNDITRMVSETKFYDGNYNIENLVNQPSAIRANNICRVNISTSFLHVAPIKATLELPIGDQQGKFTFKGSVGGGDATILNPILEPTSLVKIRKGTIKNLDVNLNGNNTRADGTVTILYDGLKVDVLKMGKDSGFNKKGFTSFVGNVIIKDANPKKGDPVRVAEVHHVRGMNRSIFNFIWKSILEGVNTSINNPKKMKNL